MIHNDIINPLLDQFLSRITGYGGPYFKSSAITRLNDFVNYLAEITYPDFNFAFYPLRKDQNLGYGKEVLGIGNLASGTNIFFRNASQANWTENGIFMDSVGNCGEINFSGRVIGDFQFRRDTCSVFYFLQHTRQSFPTTFYRNDVDQVPYFCFDRSTDHFTITAPNFSKDRARQRGTTYIYDEIYGEDQKGIQIDWTDKPSNKYYFPTSLSFYQMDKDVPSGQFICINNNIYFDYYTLRTIYGKDPTILSGNFLRPYTQFETIENTTNIKTTRYFFPRRMVIGAGVSNESEVYNVNGMSHICPGVLILKGDYSERATEIARKMSEGIGIINETFQPYSPPKESANITSNILEIEHIAISSKTIPQIKSASTFTSKIKEIFWQLVGILKFDFFPWGALGTSPVETAQLKIDANVEFSQGIKDYNYSILGSKENLPIYGFISGFVDQNGNREIFYPGNSFASSGYFITGNGPTRRYFFPPYKEKNIQRITGFISGYYNEFGEFSKINQVINVSGYYLDNQKFFLNPDTEIATEQVIGFISGTIDNNLFFTPFPEYNINATSGYIINDTIKNFPPYKYISGVEKVIGYARGFMDINGELYLYAEEQFPDNETDRSGYLYKNERFSFPTGENFNGFYGMEHFDENLGFEFSGFFIESSGLIENSDIITGIIGYKAAIYNSGEFDGFNNLEDFDSNFGYTYNGFFVNNESNFSGIIENWQGIFDTMTGILTGYIGSYNYLKPVDTVINFDGKPGFDIVLGYEYSGFFPGRSGFKGLNGNDVGLGEMTGFIGYRNLPGDLIVPFNGFTGQPEIEPEYSANVFVDFKSENLNFSGNNGSATGLGIFSGIISSGNFAGDLARFSINTGVSKYTGYNFPVSGLYHNIGVITGIISITGYSDPPINDFPLYYSGELDHTGSIQMTGSVTGLQYWDGIISGFIGGRGYIDEENQIISGELPSIIGFVSGTTDNLNRFITGFNTGNDTISRLGYGCTYFSGNESYCGLHLHNPNYIYPIDPIFEYNSEFVGNFQDKNFTIEMWIKPLDLNFSISDDLEEKSIIILESRHVEFGFPFSWNISIYPPYLRNTGINEYEILPTGDASMIRFKFNTGFNEADGFYSSGMSIPGQPVNIDEWNHIAIVRSGSFITTYLNGSGGVPSEIGTGIIKSINNRLYIGDTYRPDLPFRQYINPFNGYIEDLRITKNIPRYTENFDNALPNKFPNNLEGDIYYNDVQLLAPMNGYNYYKTFLDNSLSGYNIFPPFIPSTVTINNPQDSIISSYTHGDAFTIGPDFYGGSGFFIGSNKYLLPTGNDFSGFQYIEELNTPVEINAEDGNSYFIYPYFDFSGFFHPNFETNFTGINNTGILSGYIGTRTFNLNTQFSVPENATISGGVKNLTYITGFLETGISGMEGTSFLYPSGDGDYASGVCDISSIEYYATESYQIYPYIRATSGFAFVSGSIKSINYFEDMPLIGEIETTKFSGSIKSIRHFALVNEWITEESGIYGPDPFSITLSTEPPPSHTDSVQYRPIAISLTGDFPAAIVPPSIEGISDIEELTEDPYFDNVVLLLNMSGNNSSNNLKDSSKYHRKVVAVINANSNFDSGFYNVSGVNVADPKSQADSGFYNVSGVNTTAPFSIEGANYQVSVFDVINPNTGYNYYVDFGTYQATGIYSVNPETGYGLHTDSGMYNVSPSGFVNDAQDSLIFSTIYTNETGARFGLSGNSSINYDTYRFIETGASFGLSGNSSINYDTFRIIETGAQIGVSGVILITGQF